MAGSPPSGFSWTSKLKLIEVIGFSLAVCGLLVNLIGIGQLFVSGEFAGPSSASVCLGSLMFLTGLDIVVRPNARRLPSPQRIVDTVLRYRAGLAPEHPWELEDAMNETGLSDGRSIRWSGQPERQPGRSEPL